MSSVLCKSAVSSSCPLPVPTAPVQPLCQSTWIQVSILLHVASFFSAGVGCSCLIIGPSHLSFAKWLSGDVCYPLILASFRAYFLGKPWLKQVSVKRAKRNRQMLLKENLFFKIKERTLCDHQYNWNKMTYLFFLWGLVPNVPRIGLLSCFHVKHGWGPLHENIFSLWLCSVTVHPWQPVMKVKYLTTWSYNTRVTDIDWYPPLQIHIVDCKASWKRLLKCSHLALLA